MTICGVIHNPLLANHLKTESANKPSESVLSSDLHITKNTSNTLSVPNKIHHFWQGDMGKLDRYLPNIQKTAELNPTYEVRLHILPNKKQDAVSFQDKLIGVKVKDISEEKWFKDFQKSPRHEQFHASRSGERKHLASGADIIKSELMKKGGIWNDVDNKPLKALPESLSVNRGGFLTAGPVTFDRWGGESGVHSSTFATHKHNETLRDMNDSSYEKFLGEKGTIYEKNTRTDAPDEHFKMISETAGSLHFSRELKQRVPGHAEEISELLDKGEKFNNKNTIMDQYFEPVSSTGSGDLDDDQAKRFLESISPPGHVVI